MKFKLNEDLFDDVIEIEIPKVEVEQPVEVDEIELSGPTPGPSMGDSSLLLSAIAECAKTIDDYNILKANLSDSRLADIVGEMANQQNLILGKLQGLLKEVSPNAENIMTGAVETEYQLKESIKEDKLDNDIYGDRDDNDFYDKDEHVNESFKLDEKYIDPLTNKLKVESWADGQLSEEPNKIDDWIPDNMDIDDEF